MYGNAKSVITKRLTGLYFHGFDLGDVSVLGAEFLALDLDASVEFEKPRALLAPEGVP